MLAAHAWVTVATASVHVMHCGSESHAERKRKACVILCTEAESGWTLHARPRTCSSLHTSKILPLGILYRLNLIKLKIKAHYAYHSLIYFICSSVLNKLEVQSYLIWNYYWPWHYWTMHFKVQFRSVTVQL